MSAQRETISARGEVLQFSRRIVEQLENTISLGELAARRTQERQKVYRKQGRVRFIEEFKTASLLCVALMCYWETIDQLSSEHSDSNTSSP